MNTVEAHALLVAELEQYRKHSYAELRALVDSEPIVLERRGVSEAVYQLEIQAFWDDKPNGPVRIRGAIDDGGLRAFVPVTDSFIVAPDGSFVG